MLDTTFYLTARTPMVGFRDFSPSRSGQQRLLELAHEQARRRCDLEALRRGVALEDDHRVGSGPRLVPSQTEEGGRGDGGEAAKGDRRGAERVGRSLRRQDDDDHGSVINRAWGALRM